MSSDRLSARDEILLVRVADGVRSPTDERLEAIPDADRLIARQRRAARALAAGEPRPQVAPARVVTLRPRLVAAACAVAALVLVLVVAVPGDERSTVMRAAALAQQPDTDAPPPTDGASLRASVEGVRFPAWRGRFGWREVGMRRDELDGRATATVYYEHQGHRVAYTILSGAPLPRPEGARVVRRDGVEIALYRDPAHGGHDIAVFERGGRTCVVAGHVREVSTLVKLAAWRGRT